MFEREVVLNSDWYKARLVEKQNRDIALWTKNVAYMEDVLSRKNFASTVVRLDLPSRLEAAKAKLEMVSSPSYLDYLKGSLGVDPMQPIAE